MTEKLQFEQIQKASCTSFRYDWSRADCREEIGLHFHPEIEIAYIAKGAGYRMTGDFLESFSLGEVVFIPSGLPHCWIHDPDSCAPDGCRECLVVQFMPSFLQEGMSFFAEWAYAARRLLALRQATEIGGRAAGQIKSILREMERMEASERLLSVLRIIELAGGCPELRPIGMPGRSYTDITKQMERMQLIFKYSMEHYKEKITLADMAGVVSMSVTAFCAFFKRETGTTFTAYLNAYRLEVACGLLRNYPDKEVSEIAWQCGFTDIPYFNRYFRRMMQQSPGQWRKKRVLSTEAAPS